MRVRPRRERTVGDAPESHAEEMQDAVGCLAPVVDSGHDEIGAAHHVATGEDLGVGGLAGEAAGRIGAHPAVVVQLHAQPAEPGRRIGAKT